MESNDAATQLGELERVRAATRHEAFKTPRTAWPVLGTATVVWFSLFAVVESDRGRLGLALVWTAFVAIWAWWLRVGRGAVAPRPVRTRSQRRRDVLEFVALMGACFVLVQVLSLVSWTLTGVAMAIVSMGWSVRVRRRV